MAELSVNRLKDEMARHGYVASDDLAMAVHLALALGRPLLLEGAAGVGKTEVGRILSLVKDAELIRLQCYEGLDASQAIYEWNYQRQLLAIRAAAEDGKVGESVEARIFSEDFLLQRPLLRAIRQPKAPVLLIDEVDRADEEFEAYLLEVLSEFRITVPELGAIEAVTKPIVILTANGARDLSDALRRRCLYAFVDYPDRGAEIAILRSRFGRIEARLAERIVDFVHELRKEDLEKVPGIAETLDFASALMGLGVADLSRDPEAVGACMATLLKTQSDRGSATAELVQRIAGRAA